MELRINPAELTHIRASKSLKRLSQKTNRDFTYVNSQMLPAYKPFLSNVSFKGTKISERFTAEDFLLKPGCQPDIYQINSAKSLLKGNNTIVTAPTGTGKTAIAHYIIKKNFEESKKTYYTTPLKALSNQKYHDLKKLFGKNNVGILTGDRKENVQAPIIVMTTEIYRNMAFSNYFGDNREAFDDLNTVIFDEFHYMGDPDRGGVWEESIMYTPKKIQILALSATVGNNKKITSWIESIKDRKKADLIDVPASERHVPLSFAFYNPKDKKHDVIEDNGQINVKMLEHKINSNGFDTAQKQALEDLAEAMGYSTTAKGKKEALFLLIDAFKNQTVSIEKIEKHLKTLHLTDTAKALSAIKNINRKTYTPKLGQVISSKEQNKPNPRDILDLVESLDKEKKLPAIAFVFSKKYSEELLDTSLSYGKDLTTADEKKKIQEHINEYKTRYGLYSTSLNESALLKGYAIHSAAILPLQKQLVEELFNKKHLKVAFATETLAAGINMPAKTVIMTDYRKPMGADMQSSGSRDFLRPLLPNEFHQMCGRAGRRGIDKVGYAILVAGDMESQKEFRRLQNSAPNEINSSLKLDASNVTGFLSINHNPSEYRKILKNSFWAFNIPDNIPTPSLIDQTRDRKINEQYNTFKNYISLLEDYGFVEKYQTGYLTTVSGRLINDLKGKPQIPVIKSLLDNHFGTPSPANLAGLIAAIAVSPKVENFPLMEIAYEESNSANNKELRRLNGRINEKLSEELGFSQNELSAKDSNAKILEAIREKFGISSQYDTNDLSKKVEHYTKVKLSVEEKCRKYKNYKLNQEEQAVMDTAEKMKKAKLLLKNLKRIQFIQNFLEEREQLMIKMPSAEDMNQSEEQLQEKYGAYNQLVQDFNEYNDKVEVMPGIPKISLNETTFKLVQKWAEINAMSDDYKENWKYICGQMRTHGTLKYEGDLFNAISQTIDFIHQFEDVLKNASECAESQEKAIYYQTLRKTCKQAVKLMKNPPLYNSEEI